MQFGPEKTFYINFEIPGPQKIYLYLFFIINKFYVPNCFNERHTIKYNNWMWICF